MNKNRNIWMGIALGLVMLTLPSMAEKVQVTSNKMKGFDLKKEVHFIGNAKVSQLKDWIHADEIIVYFDKGREAKKYVADGKVTFELHREKGVYKGKADKVVYFPKKSKYVLTGHAVVDDILNNRHVNGNEIVLDTKTGNASVKGSEKRPVKFIFEVGKKSE